MSHGHKLCLFLGMKIQNKSCLEMLTKETFWVIFNQCDVDVEACIKREKDPKFNQSSRA